MSCKACARVRKVLPPWLQRMLEGKRK